MSHAQTMTRSSRFDRVRIGSIVVRCHEFDHMLAFWQAALGYVMGMRIQMVVS